MSKLFHFTPRQELEMAQAKAQALMFMAKYGSASRLTAPRAAPAPAPADGADEMLPTMEATVYLGYSANLLRRAVIAKLLNVYHERGQRCALYRRSELDALRRHVVVQGPKALLIVDGKQVIIRR